MTHYDVAAETVDAQGESLPLAIVKRAIASPSIENGTLFIDDFGVKLEGIDTQGEIAVTLRIKPATGPRR